MSNGKAELYVKW